MIRDTAIGTESVPRGFGRCLIFAGSYDGAIHSLEH